MLFAYLLLSPIEVAVDENPFGMVAGEQIEV
jgi:hypothetical protein